MAVGDLFEELRVVSNLSLKSLNGAPLVMLVTVYRDLHVGLPALPTLRVEPSMSEGIIQPTLHLADSLSEAVLDGSVIGLHAQYYV